MPIDYDSARGDLLAAFGAAEEALLSGGAAGNLPQRFSDVADAVFASRTQAFREVLLGCVLARIQDKGIDIRLPYVSQGDSAYNGRTLDERVVNPMLQEKRGPRRPEARSLVCSGAWFRLFLLPETGCVTRLHTMLSWRWSGFVEEIDDDEGLRAILEALAFRFVELREASDVPLTRVQRMSLEQVVELTARLLDTPSGGRLPVYAVVAMVPGHQSEVSAWLGHSVARYKRRGHGLWVSEADISGCPGTLRSWWRKLPNARLTETGLSRRLTPKSARTESGTTSTS